MPLPHPQSQMANATGRVKPDMFWCSWPTAPAWVSPTKAVAAWAQPGSGSGSATAEAPTTVPPVQTPSLPYFSIIRKLNLWLKTETESETSLASQVTICDSVVQLPSWKAHALTYAVSLCVLLFVLAMPCTSFFFPVSALR